MPSLAWAASSGRQQHSLDGSGLEPPEPPAGMRI
jgi:hypothetical protein